MVYEVYGGVLAKTMTSVNSRGYGLKSMTVE